MDRPLVLLVIVALLAAAVVGRTWTPRGRASLLRTTARRADLGVPAVASPVARRLQQRRTAAAAGAVTGLAVGVLVVPPETAGEVAPSLTVPLVLGLGLLGLAVATCGHAVAASRRPLDADAPRVARSRDVGLADYVNPFERRSMVVVSVLPAGLGLVAATLLGTGVLEAPPVRLPLLVALAVAPLLLLAVSLVLVRLVLGARQPAPSTEDLVWDDALRSQALRDVISLPLYAGVTASVLVAAEVSVNLPTDLAPAATGLLVLGSLVVLAGLLVVSLAVRPAQHFRHALWPVEHTGARP